VNTVQRDYKEHVFEHRREVRRSVKLIFPQKNGGAVK
jgi:hypothetical protein